MTLTPYIRAPGFRVGFFDTHSASSGRTVKVPTAISISHTRSIFALLHFLWHSLWLSIE